MNATIQYDDAKQGVCSMGGMDNFVIIFPLESTEEDVRDYEETAQGVFRQMRRLIAIKKQAVEMAVESLINGNTINKFTKIAVDGLLESK